MKTNILGEIINSYSKEMTKHRKNPNIGKKQTWFASSIWIEQKDAKAFEEEEEVQ